MLLRLSIRDFVIVDALELEFAPGFTVLSGETGAGKSILVDALSLALGERADGAQIRHGAERAEIAAEFDAQQVPAATAWLRDNQLDADEGVLLLRRTLDAGGRSRAWINGRAATVAQLAELGDRLVDIHGQHVHQSLIRRDAQRELLDGFASARACAAATADAFRQWQRIRELRREREQNAQAIATERDALTWQIGELQGARFDPAEWPELLALHRRLAHAADLAAAVGSTLAAFSDDEMGLLGRLDT